MHLTVKSIAASNFRCFRDLYLSVPSKDIYYLEGENYDASYTQRNGVGKSTLMDIIPMILFGRGIRDADRKKLAYKDYLKYGTQTANLVMKLVDSENKEYTVRRELTLKGSTLVLELGDTVLQNQFAADFLKDKMGLTFQSFITSSLFGQGKFKTFLTAGEEEKVGLLEELFKLKQIEDIRSELKKQYDEMVDIFNGASKEASIAESDYKIAETKYTTLKEMYSNDRSKAVHFLNTNMLKEVSDNLDVLAVAYKRKSNYLTDIESQITAAETVLNSNAWGTARNPLEVNKPCPLCKRIVEVGPDEQELIERQNKKQAEYNNLKEQLLTLKKEKGKFFEEISALDIQIREAAQEKKNIEAEIVRANELLSLSELAIENSLTILNDKSLEFSTASHKLKKIIEERAERKELRDILGEKELRAIIVGLYLPLINHYAQKYITFITNGELSIEFSFKSNKIETEIIDSKNNYRLNYFSYSGGEAQRLDIGLFLAFSSVNRHILKSPLNILLLDEIFDALDELGIDKAIELLESEKNTFGCILITGHNENLSEKFSNKINLIKRGGLTTLA
jgi:DNA repair exonuclease SbcCD ATPase subunit